MIVRLHSSAYQGEDLLADGGRGGFVRLDWIQPDRRSRSTYSRSDA